MQEGRPVADVERQHLVERRRGRVGALLQGPELGHCQPGRDGLGGPTAPGQHGGARLGGADPVGRCARRPEDLLDPDQLLHGVRLDAEGQLALLHRRQLLAGSRQHLGEVEPDPLHAGRLLLPRDELAQRPGQAIEVALRGVDVAQRLQRPLAGRIRGQDRLVGLDGLGRVAQLHAHQPAQLVVEPGHLAPVHGGGDADAQVRGQLAPPLQLLQQLLERRQRLLVTRPQPNHLAPELDRLLGPPQLGRQRRLPGQQPLASGGVAHHRALRRQVARQLLLAAGRVVERLERLQGWQVPRVDRQGLLVGVGRLVGHGQPLLAEPAEPVEELHPIAAGGRHGPRLQHLGQLGPGLEPLQEPLQRRERHRRGGRVERASPLVPLGRLRRPVRASPRRADPAPARPTPWARAGASRPRPRRAPPAPRTGRSSPPAPRCGRAARRRPGRRGRRARGPRRPARARPAAPRGGRPAGTRGPCAPADRGGPRRASPAPWPAAGGCRRRRRPSPAPGGARVAGILVEHGGEPRQRLRRVGARRQHLLVEGQRPITVHQPGLLQLAQPLAEDQHRGRVAGLPGGRELATQQVAQLHPALAGHVQPVEPGHGHAVPRGQLQQPLQRGRGAGRIAEPLLLQHRQVRQQGHPPLGPLLERQRTPQRLLQRLGVGATAQRVEQAGARLAILRRQLQQPLPGLGGARRVRLQAGQLALVLHARRRLVGAVGVLGEEDLRPGRPQPTCFPKPTVSRSASIESGSALSARPAAVKASSPLRIWLP